MSFRVSIHLIPLALSLAFGAPVLFDFETDPDRGLKLVQNRASISQQTPLGGQRSLLLDSTADATEWNPCAVVGAGSFLPGSNYLVTFTVRLLEAGPKGNLHVLVRPTDAGGAGFDVARLDVHEVGLTKKVRLKVKIQPGQSNQALQFHGHFKMRALIDDIAIQDGSGERFIPAAAQPTPYKGALSLPTGSAKFEVEMPKAKGPTVSVAEFGARPESPDNVKAFNDAIAACRAKGAGRLVVPKGIYRFTNNDPIRFEGLGDFDFDGQGSEFIWLKTRQACIEIVGSSRVAFRNFVIDWDWEKDPLGSIVQVAGVAPDGAWVDLDFIHYKDFPRKDVRIGILEAVDPATLSPGVEGGFDIGHEFFRNATSRRAAYEWLSGNRLRLQAYSADAMSKYAKQTKVGDLFRIRHYVYDPPGVVMRGNTNLTLSNVSLYGAAGHGFVTSGEQHHWQFLETHIKPRPGTARPITCTADHHHIAQSLGYYKMIGCEFGYGGDDCLNVHDTTGFAFKTGPQTLTTRNMSVGGLSPGDRFELRHDDYAPTGAIVTLVEKKGSGQRDQANELRFQEALPEQRTGGFILFNQRYNSEHIVVSNCTFRDNRARGLLILARNVTVASNRFFHNQKGAIKIETGYTFNVWSEGYGVSNVLIRNNVFDTVNPYREYASELHPNIYISVYLKSDPSEEKTTFPILKDISIEGNTFIHTPGVIAYVCSASNVMLRGNTIRNPVSWKENLPHRGAVGVSFARDVKVLENTWIKSPYAPNMGVYVDVETSRDILVQGNRILEK